MHWVPVLQFAQGMNEKRHLDLVVMVFGYRPAGNIPSRGRFFPRWDLDTDDGVGCLGHGGEKGTQFFAVADWIAEAREREDLRRIDVVELNSSRDRLLPLFIITSSV